MGRSDHPWRLPLLKLLLLLSVLRRRRQRGLDQDGVLDRLESECLVRRGLLNREVIPRHLLNHEHDVRCKATSLLGIHGCELNLLPDEICHTEGMCTVLILASKFLTNRVISEVSPSLGVRVFLNNLFRTE